MENNFLLIFLLSMLMGLTVPIDVLNVHKLGRVLHKGGIIRGGTLAHTLI